MGTFHGPLAVEESGNPERPLRLIKPLRYTADSGATHEVHAGFVTDLASTPGIVRLFYSRLDETAKPAVLHDFLYWKNESRCAADALFFEAMMSVGAAVWKARAYWFGVRLGGAIPYYFRSKFGQEGCNMRISDDGVAHIKEFEGYHTENSDGTCSAYKCPGGKWTIGWGCTEGVRPGDRWTREQAEQGLRAELGDHERAVGRLVKVPLSQTQFDVLVSFSYNVGYGEDGLGGSTLLRLLNAGDFEGAARQLPLWKFSDGVVLPGLVRRRATERAMFELGDVDDTGPMAQTVDVPTPIIDAIFKSGTLRGNLAGLFGVAMVKFDEAFNSAAQAGAEIVRGVPMLESALKVLGLNADGVGFAMAVGGLVYAALRRLKAAEDQKIG